MLSFSSSRGDIPIAIGRTCTPGSKPDTLSGNKKAQHMLSFSSSRGDRIRTCDPLVPNQMRYRPALLPELFVDLAVFFLISKLIKAICGLR
jgi:hypothetical protein